MSHEHSAAGPRNCRTCAAMRHPSRRGTARRQPDARGPRVLAQTRSNGESGARA